MIENRSLAQGLFKHGQVDEQIPVLYYKIVAGILVELYKKGFRRKPTQNEGLTEEGDEPYMEN
jgi:flagellar biosynthesis protein FlhB